MGRYSKKRTDALRRHKSFFGATFEVAVVSNKFAAGADE